MAGVRTTSLTMALLTPLALLVACGDGVDERYDSHGDLVAADAAGEVHNAPATTTTLAPREFDTFRVDHPSTEFEDTTALYSGASNALHLGDTWLVAGFDNESDFSQPERGALWRSDDLETWQRIGLDISGADSQQTISALVQVDDAVVALGNDFLHGDPESGEADAVAWLSDDSGETFDRVVIETDAIVDDAVVLGDVLWVVGASNVDGDLVGQLWRSTDGGRSWEATDPQAVPSPGAAPMGLGPLSVLLEWDGSLIAIGTTVTTDPQGGNYFLPQESYGFGEGVAPIDLAIWYSDDEGVSWHATRPAGLAGQLGAADSSRAVVVGDQLIIGGTTVEGFDFNDPDADFELFGKATPTIWICDYTLQRCAADAVDFQPADLGGVALAATDDLVVYAAEGVDLETESSDLTFGVLDPLTGDGTAERANGAMEQVEAVIIEDGTIYWFGRDPETNLMHAATSELPV